MKMKVKKTFIILMAAVLLFIFTGCRSEDTGSSGEQNTSFSQNEIKEPKELAIPQNGKLEIELETIAKPDGTTPEEKAIFLCITLKEKSDISMQYTYDTYGKEGMMLCCEAAVSDDGQTSLRPIASTYLAQLSEENYGKTWLSSGLTLENGENIFYVNGGDQTLPYRMAMTITFLEPDNVEKVVMYPTSA